MAFNNIDLKATPYHAAISFSESSYNAMVNFGTKPFKFGLEDMLGNHYKEMYEEINSKTVDSKEVFDIVHDYLVHSGYVGTLQAFESESSCRLIPEDKAINVVNTDYTKFINRSGFALPRKNTLGPEMMSLTARRESEALPYEEIGASLTSRDGREEEEKEPALLKVDSESNVIPEYTTEDQKENSSSILQSKKQLY